MSTASTDVPGDPMPTFRIPPPPISASAFWSTPVIKDAVAITTRTRRVCKMEETAEMWRRILAVRFNDWSLAVSPVNSPLTEPPDSPELSELDDDMDEDGMSSGSDIPFAAPRSSPAYMPPLFVRQYLEAARAGTRVGPTKRTPTRPAGRAHNPRRPLLPYTPLDPYWDLGPPTQIPRQNVSELRSTASHEEATWRNDASTQTAGPAHPQHTGLPHGPATGPCDSEKRTAATTSCAPPIVDHELGTAMYSPDGTETDPNGPSPTPSSSTNPEETSDPYSAASPTLHSPSPPPTPPWEITDPALIPQYTLTETKHACRTPLPTQMLTLVLTRTLPGDHPLPFLLLYCLPGFGPDAEHDEALMIEWRDVKEHALHEISELADRYTDPLPDLGERQRARTRLLANLHFGIATGSSVRMYDFDRGDDGVFLLEECAWAKQEGPRLNVRETPLAFLNLVDCIAGWG
ncbi:hypothetical protein BP00DRAFT_412904 [Aspergillus indologenus CBS 114.80]|uniref:Uncharacterized protein n=1 Tax=Aspergillus indologenus CBS 114.80 TaxID=1450541 RepID=A0A2V5IJZ8_9EURO|nr:hypothetical protein BP00DRAFT_412904 [Aspergillus indologenus CBS 114.80]